MYTQRKYVVFVKEFCEEPKNNLVLQKATKNREKCIYGAHHL